MDRTSNASHRRLAVVPEHVHFDVDEDGRATRNAATEAAVLLSHIRFFESVVGIPANFADPMANPGRIAAKVFRYNELTRTRTGPDAA